MGERERFPRSPSIQERVASMLLAVVASGQLLAQVPESMDPGQVPNYAVVDSGLAAAGQPTEEGLRQLKAHGFRTVINLRTDGEEGVAGERGVVEGLGLRYVHVPVSSATFRTEDAAAVRAVLEDPSAAPVLLHCTTSNRVGGVWAVIQALRGKSPEDAEAEGRRAGLKSEAMVEAARRVIRESRPAPNR